MEDNVPAVSMTTFLCNHLATTLFCWKDLVLMLDTSKSLTLFPYLQEGSLLVFGDVIHNAFVQLTNKLAAVARNEQVNPVLNNINDGSGSVALVVQPLAQSAVVPPSVQVPPVNHVNVTSAAVCINLVVTMSGKLLHLVDSFADIGVDSSARAMKFFPAVKRM